MTARGDKKIAWVTGASGFIGGHVRQRFQDLGWTVVSIDRRRPTYANDASFTADVDEHSLGAAYDTFGPPQTVFHGAGTGVVSVSAANPHACRRDTVESTRTLLAFLHGDAPHCRVVFPSSAAVYGSVDEGPLAEERPLAPISTYGEHKQAAEHLCLAAAARGQPVAILRMFSVYGPGLRKQLPWDLGRKLLTGAGPIDLYGTGNETRDFLAVEDAAAMIVALATEAHPSPLIINGGTGHATTVSTFALQLSMALGVTREIRFNGETRAGDPRFYRADIRRLNALGLVAHTKLAEGVAAYAAWLKSLTR